MRIVPLLQRRCPVSAQYINEYQRFTANSQVRWLLCRVAERDWMQGHIV
jgi:hypothetical protein